MAKSITQVINKKVNLIMKYAKIGAENILAENINQKLIEKIETNFYQRYKVGDKHWLVSSLKVKVTSNLDKILVEVYFDNKKLAHTTWWGSKKLGIQSNSKVYTPKWINDGWTYIPNERKRMIDVGGVNFMEDTIKELNSNQSWINEFKSYMDKLK